MTDEQRREVAEAWNDLQDACFRLANLGDIEDPELDKTVERIINYIDNAMMTLWHLDI